MKKRAFFLLTLFLAVSVSFAGCDLINDMFGGKEAAPPPTPAPGVPAPGAPTPQTPPAMPGAITESGYLNGPGSSFVFPVNAGADEYVDVTFTYPKGTVDFWVTVTGEDGSALGNFDLDNGEVIQLMGGGTFWLTIYSVTGMGNWSATYSLDTAAPTPTAPEVRASVNGKYYNLLSTLYVPQDQGSYGDFYEWGYWSGTSYAGYSNLPAGYWIYVYPNWYIWGNQR
jgi:hypothetical protein